MLSRKLMAMCVLILLGIFCVSPMAWGENLTNLALKKNARQSSTGYGGDAQRAVDGNRDGNSGANSVTHTNNSPGEWWEVDLGSVQQIKEIIIWNRTDCCGERLADFSVLVSEQPFSSNGLDNLHTLLGDSSVWSYRNEGVAGVQTQVPVDAAGRYVRIQMAGANYLSLAEVEVMGESRGGKSGGKSGGYGAGSKASDKSAASTNLALKKKARQSSTTGGDAQRAVDGNRDGNYSANSVTHTGNSPGEWWEVDLGSVQQIKEINIWNRTDCCSERLADFSVMVSERSFSSNNLDNLLADSSVWSYRNDGAAGKQTQVSVDVPGRYVRIQMAGANYLSLAEVEVMGESRGGKSGGYGGGSKVSAAPAASTNLALKKNARQSSTGYGGDAQRAVDGNRDGNNAANSVTHTNNSPGEWWEVDLGSVRQIKEINIWNRTDCCGERLADFSVLVSERPFSSNNLDNLIGDSSVWSYRNDGAAGKQTQVPVDVSGRYVRIQLSGANYLSLAEVEVMGQ